MSPEREAEFAKKFPKLASHEFRGKIIQMVEEGVAAERISAWTYDLSRERGVEPGTKSPFSVSVPTMTWFARWWREGQAKERPVEGPRPAPSALAASEELLLSASEKRDRAIGLLDRVIQKAEQTLEQQERVTIQTAMQAMAMREQLESQKELKIEFSIEVRTILAQIVQIVNEECDVDTRLRVAERLERLPTWRSMMAAKQKALPEESNVTDAEFVVQEAVGC